MGASGGLKVRGYVADVDTGAALGGLQVELWHANGHDPNLVTTGESDEAGQFELDLSPDAVAGLGDTGSADVELRVLDDGTLIQTEARELPTDSDVDLAVPVFAPSPHSRNTYRLEVPPEDAESVA